MTTAQESTPPVPVTDPSTLVIAAVPEDIKTARDFARRWFEARAVDDCGTGLLVISELVTNAYRHGSEPGGPVLVRLYLSDDGPVVEVRDTSAAEPYVKPFTLTEFSGRGLATIQLLTRSWGFHHLSSGGKAVYAVLGERPDRSPPGRYSRNGRPS
ncbi:ATP-binding protein [Actinomadura kijaniata]|uniref:ATP-binding protein n=1 Tax=Actinomadura kijaniata TaxID=46161 RepID=UPI003F1AF5FF